MQERFPGGRQISQYKSDSSVEESHIRRGGGEYIPARKESSVLENSFIYRGRKVSRSGIAILRLRQKDSSLAGTGSSVKKELLFRAGRKILALPWGDSFAMEERCFAVGEADSVGATERCFCV